MGNLIVWLSFFLLSVNAYPWEDSKPVQSETIIEGNLAVRQSYKIKNPEYIRYLSSENPESYDLYDIEGLPASLSETEQNK